MTSEQRRGEPELNSGILPGNVHLDDWVMFICAVGSVGLLGYTLISPPSPAAGRWMFLADCVLCVVFLADLLWRWHRRHWTSKFLARSWYEVFAMIPVATPALLDHRFILSVLLLVRFGRAADRALGEQFFYRLVERMSDPIVHAIKKPVTIAVLDEVVRVIETGNYPENLARSLQANKSELRGIIMEKVTEDPQLGRLKHVPFHDEMVRGVVDTSFRVLLEVLLDPRIDDFFASVVRENRQQIRQAVQLGLNDDDREDSEKLLPTRTDYVAANESSDYFTLPGRT